MSHALPLLQVQPAPDRPAGPLALAFGPVRGAAGDAHRVVLLRELAYIPLEAREDPDILGKQWAALRGLYNADVDFIYTAAGMYRPRHVGLVQFYGAAAEDPNPQKAHRLALAGLRAVEAVLANFVYSRLADPSSERLRQLLDLIRTLPSLLAILGHPDPRHARKGLSRDAFTGVADEELASQQGEILMRGLAKLREDFVFMVTACHVERLLLTDALVRMSRVSSQYASRQRGNINIGFSMALPLAAALSSSVQGSEAAGTSAADSATRTDTEGGSRSESAGWSESGGSSQGTASSRGTAVSQSTTETAGQAVSRGEAWSTSQARGTSRTDSVGTGESGSVGTSQTDTESRGWQTASSWTEGVSQSRTVSEGSSEQASRSESSGNSTAFSRADGGSVTDTAGRSQTSSQATGTTATNARQTTAGTAVSSGAGGQFGGGAFGLRGSAGGQGGVSSTTGAGQTDTAGTSSTATEGSSESRTHSEGGSWTQTQSEGTSRTASRGTARGTSASVADQSGASRSEGGVEGSTTGTAQSRTTGSQQGWSRMQNTAVGQSHQETESHANSRSATESQARAVQQGTQTSEARTRTETTSRQWGTSGSAGASQTWQTSQALAHTQGVTSLMSLGRGFSGGFSSGIVPGLHIGRGWQTEDDTARALASLTRGLVSLLDRASMEGGFLTSALLLVGERGQRAASALIPQAFHGPDVPTPVLTVAGDSDLRAQAMAFRPSLQGAQNPFDIDILWTRWSTLLTPGMLAAYTAPNLFEEGVALTFQEKLPPLAFYPELPGEVVCGHQISPETGDRTDVPLRIARDRHFHTAFCGDTGFGKSVAAERLIHETTGRWRLRTIVLDFGTGWRKLLNAPDLQGRVEIRQLSPGGVRPLRWNPLQIGRNILPEVQWRTFCDVFGQIAQLGQRRQVHELRDALRRAYLASGVLVDDPVVQESDTWGLVRFEEQDLLDPAPGTPLAELTVAERQRLAVHRSRRVGLKELYAQIEDALKTISRRDMVLRTVLEGILFRLHPLVQGAASLQYTAGPDCIDINEIVPGDWGVAVLEGGAFLDDFSKGFLLGWAAWHLYHDAVALRPAARSLGAGPHPDCVRGGQQDLLRTGTDRRGGRTLRGRTIRGHVARQPQVRDLAASDHAVAGGHSGRHPLLLQQHLLLPAEEPARPGPGDLGPAPQREGASWTKPGGASWPACPWAAVWSSWATPSSAGKWNPLMSTPGSWTCRSPWTGTSRHGWAPLNSTVRQGRTKPYEIEGVRGGGRPAGRRLSGARPLAETGGDGPHGGGGPRSGGRTQLAATDLQVRMVPAAELPPDALTDPEPLLEQTLSVVRFAGETVALNHLGPAIALAPDERGIAVRVKTDSGLAGLLQPGQRVDWSRSFRTGRDRTSAAMPRP